ncbi:hypothetical protein CQ062_01835 [Ochrobactrum sp. MYb68]|nr:hypothetical protein CQ062_01835 [Ochrobactrum sp. MYb68]
MIVDLDEPRFTQNEVLRMLPNLKAKQLQNWNQRGILDVGDQKPGKTGKRLYSAMGIILLDFMQQVNRYGVPPSDAVEMAMIAGTIAIEYVASDPEVILVEGEHRWIPIGPEQVQNMRRGIITVLDNEKYYIQMEGDGVWDVDTYRARMIHHVGILVEVEQMIALCINRIFLLEAGKI